MTDLKDLTNDDLVSLLHYPGRRHDILVETELSPLEFERVHKAELLRRLTPAPCGDVGELLDRITNNALYGDRCPEYYTQMNLDVPRLRTAITALEAELAEARRELVFLTDNQVVIFHMSANGKYWWREIKDANLIFGMEKRGPFNTPHEALSNAIAATSGEGEGDV